DGRWSASARASPRPRRLRVRDRAPPSCAWQRTSCPRPAAPASPPRGAPSTVLSQWPAWWSVRRVSPGECDPFPRARIRLPGCWAPFLRARPGALVLWFSYPAKYTSEADGAIAYPVSGILPTAADLVVLFDMFDMTDQWRKSQGAGAQAGAESRVQYGGV